MEPARAPNRADLARPLEDGFQSVLQGIAGRRKLPSYRDPEKLAENVAALSRVYNARSEGSPADAAFLGARLCFSFPRDVPKGAAAVAELVLSGALSFARGDLRVLDLGAGLGATSRGVARALAAFGAKGTIAVDLVDADETALAMAGEIAKERPNEGRVTVAARTSVRDVGTFERRGKPYDLVLVGQTLSEMDRELEPDARVAAHAALLTRLLRETVTPKGSLVVIEPALRDRSRHLHRVRDMLVAAGTHVFAPCLHQRACPALVRENDWCHEDLAVELPAWLVPTARGAGLRYEGLSFSYLVLRRDETTLRSLLPAAGLVRAVSGPLVSKGKHEVLLCPADEGRTGLVRGMRLDRHHAPKNEPWGFVERGDLLHISPPFAPELAASATARVTAETSVVPVVVPFVPPPAPADPEPAPTP